MIFQESGITFNNVKKIGTKISSFPLGNPDNYQYDGNSASRKDTEHIDYKGGIINAIDIDWNGVNTESIPEEYVLVLNTTSDVLKWIKKLEYRISILENNGSRPDNPEYYIINWDGNGATTSAYPSQTSVQSGNSVILPTTNPKREYTITWNANGGSGTIGTTKVTYTFNNWWTVRVGGDQVTSNTKPIRDTTYYAHWINPSGITLPTTNPTRSGYNFMGWATTSSATTPNVTSSTIPTGDVTYYAIWLPISVTTYTVIFNGNGGTVSGNTTRTVNAGDPIGIFPNVTYSGHELTKWTYSNGNTANSTDIVSRNITIYAQWKEVTPVVTQYRVTYHPNGGNSTPEPQTVNAGQSVTLAGAISRNADSSYTYKFSHWNTNSSNTGTSYDAGETIPVDDNIDLYAQWNKTAITPTTEYYFSVGTTAPTASNYTTANNATTTIPTTKEFTNNSGGKALVYVLVPASKTISAIDTYARVAINMVNSGTSIPNHKLYVTDGKIANGGSLTFTIS